MGEEEPPLPAPPPPDDEGWVSLDGIGPRDVAFTMYLPLKPISHWSVRRNRPLTPEDHIQPVVWVMHGVGEDIN